MVRRVRVVGPILHIIGIFVVVLGLTMLVPAWVDFALGNLEWRGFLVSAAITLRSATANP